MAIHFGATTTHMPVGEKASDPPLVWMRNTIVPKAWTPNGDFGPGAFYKIGPERKEGE
jgi:hypothetical protein